MQQMFDVFLIMILLYVLIFMLSVIPKIRNSGAFDASFWILYTVTIILLGFTLYMMIIKTTTDLL